MFQLDIDIPRKRGPILYGNCRHIFELFFKALERSKILSRAILVHIEEIIAEKMEKKESMTKHFLSSKRQVRAWLICSCIFLGRVISQISLCYFHKKIISCIILLVRKERRSRSALFGDSKKWWCTHNQITFDLVRKSITYIEKKSYLTGLIFLLGPKEWDPE